MDTSSEEYRHECEARNILALPTMEQRRGALLVIGQLRGHNEAERLRRTMMLIYDRAKRAKTEET